MELKSARQQLNRKMAEYRLAKMQVKEEKTALIQMNEKKEAILEAQVIVQNLAQVIQSEAHARISSIVTKCLETIFPDDPYEFRIKFEQKRGKTEATLLLERDGLVLDDPLWQAGVGVVDIAAFALRLACLVLSQPAPRRLMVLDEPFLRPSKEHRSRIKSLIHTLAKELGVQFIIITHDEELMDEDCILVGESE